MRIQVWVIVVLVLLVTTTRNGSRNTRDCYVSMIMIGDSC